MAKVKALAMALSAVAAAADALSELAQVLESEYTGTEQEQPTQPAPVDEVEQPAPEENKAEPEQPAPAPEKPAPAPEKPKKAAKVKKVSIEDIRAKMAAKIKENKRNEVQALLIKHSASKLSEVSEDEYPELLGELEEI